MKHVQVYTIVTSKAHKYNKQHKHVCIYIYIDIDIWMDEISAWATENTGEGIRRTKYLKRLNFPCRHEAFF